MAGTLLERRGQVKVCAGRWAALPSLAVTPPGRSRLTYRDAGVDIERGARLVERIRPLAEKTHRDGVLAGIGGFGALFELPVERYRRPVLVAGTDGVGTKLRLAVEANRHDGIGIDLVAMCANDVLAQGAEPLFFLDYYATGRLDEDAAFEVLAGIARGCELAGAALVGGETAEMPGMYAGHDYDLAGFCVGVVERDAIVDGSSVQTGDTLLGLGSSGPHANGYSLIRKILAESGSGLDTKLGDTSLAQILLEPTRIYVKSVLALLAALPVKAIAHVTGGGLSENVPRVLPDGLRARVEIAAWPRPPIFDWLQRESAIDDAELLRTFNCGIGLVVCVAARDADAASELLAQHGERVFRIGAVESAPETAPRVIYE